MIIFARQDAFAGAAGELTRRVATGVFQHVEENWNDRCRDCTSTLRPENLANQSAMSESKRGSVNGYFTHSAGNNR
jgi:hypothetical protein